MSDPNAWDMSIEEQRRQRRSMSPSKTSRVDSEIIIGLDEVELEALGLHKEELAEEVEKHQRKKRSKSPAMENIRKFSREILSRFAIKKKDQAPLIRWLDIEHIPLEEVCIRPAEFFQKPPKPFSFRDFGFMPPPQEKDEKCSYLFRRESVNEALRWEAAPTEVERINEYDPYCPLHGSRRRLAKQNRLVTMKSLMSSVDHDGDMADNLFNSYSREYVVKIIRKMKKEKESPALRVKNAKIMKKISVNLWIISLSFLFLFTAFNGLQNLQTSINLDLGTDSLITYYLSLALCSLFLPTYMIDRLGCKKAMGVSMAIYIVYLLVNAHPDYHSLIPAAVFAGAAASCLWGAKCAYIVDMGNRYAKLNYETKDEVISRFFGYFFMIVHLGQVGGNFLSSMLLGKKVKEHEFEDETDETCGHLFPRNLSLLSDRAKDNLERPAVNVIAVVCVCFAVFAVVAVMTLMWFLNALTKDVQNRKKSPTFNPEFLRLLKSNLTNSKMMLLIPLTGFSGMEKAFILGLFTKAYVGCGMGISQIGSVMAAFGISDAICSLVFGPLITLFGRMPLFMFAAVVNLLMMQALMIWPVNPADTALFYVIACVWGMADGVWNTQINGYWVDLVGTESLDFAYTNYRIWEALGSAFGFALIRLLTVKIYLLVSCGVLCIGMICLGIISYYGFFSEAQQKLRKKSPTFNPEFLRLLKSNLTNSKMMLLIPLTGFSGMEKAFILGLFTKAYVGCGMGISQIGSVMAAFGISDAICSLVFGPLITLFGRMPLFMFAAVVNLLMMQALMIWPVNPADTALFYVIACVWGMADGVWNTQINGYWVDLVGTESLDFAYTNYRIWEALGSAFGFALIRLLTVKIYLLVSCGVLCIGMICLGIISYYGFFSNVHEQHETTFHSSLQSIHREC